MSALSLLIKRVTKRQFSICKTADEMSAILDRTIRFAEGENQYLSEEDVAEIATVIPETESEETAAE